MFISSVVSLKSIEELGCLPRISDVSVSLPLGILKPVVQAFETMEELDLYKQCDNFDRDILSFFPS